MLLSNSKAADRQYGPEGGLADSEIMTVLVLYHSSRFKNFKTFYNGIVLGLLRAMFSRRSLLRAFYCTYEPRVDAFFFFLASRMGRKTDIYYIDSTPLPVCHNRRIAKHKVFTGLAARGKTSMGWFFGFKLHIVFNHQREIVALKLTPGNAADTTPVPGLTKDLSGKLFGDKGYIGQKLAQELLHRGLILMTRVRSNMKSLPVSFLDKALLNGRNIAETIIGHIKEFSSLRLPKHRSVFSAFTHVTAAIIAYQIDPLPPRPIRVILP